MSLSLRIRSACQHALDRLGDGEDPPRLVDFRYGRNEAVGCIDYRLTFQAGDRDYRVEDRYYHERHLGRDRDERPAADVWAEAYANFYNRRIYTNVSRALRTARSFVDHRSLAQGLDELEHRVRTQGGIRLEEERGLSFNPLLDHSEPVMTATVAPRRSVMPEWVTRFVTYVEICNQQFSEPVDMAELNRCIRMLTQAPGLERRRDAYQDVRYEGARGPADTVTLEMVRRAQRLLDENDGPRRRLHDHWGDLAVYGFAANRIWFGDGMTGPPDPKATARGHQLLMDNLTPEQRETYTTKKYFDVTAKSGNVYRIKAERQLNIFRMEKGKEVEKLCFLPQGGLCLGDTNLAQKIMLENDEEGARKIANKWNLVEGPRDNMTAMEVEFRRQEMLDRYATYAIRPSSVIRWDVT